MRKYKKTNKGRKERTIAITQILILIIGIVAVSWIIGGEIKVVSAVADDGCKNAGGNCISVVEKCDGEIKTGTNLCPSGQMCCGSKTTTTPPKEDDLLNDLLLTFGTAAAGGFAGTMGSTYAQKLMNMGTSPKIDPSIIPGIPGPSAPSASGTGAGGAGGGKTPKGLRKITIGKGDVPIGNILSNAMWAATTATIISQLAKKFASARNAAGISTAAWVGAGAVVTWTAIAVIFGSSGPPGWVAAVVTAIAAGIYMLVGYQDYSRELFTFTSGLWQPPSGGESCSKCNQLKYGCSAYLCHSYGAACEWKNDPKEEEGIEEGYEVCVEKNKGDRKPPTITPLKNVYGEEVFPNDKYDYSTPSAAGVKIIYKDDIKKCVPAFSSIKIALKTDEHAQCKIAAIEPVKAANTEEIFGLMKPYMAEGTAFTENHTITLPSKITASASSLKDAGYILTNQGGFSFYIRCKDVQGNINPVDYLVSFCVQTVDLDPPEITIVKPNQNEFIPYNTETTDIEVHTNEPADCRWDFDRKSYDFMNYEFDNCSQNLNEPLKESIYGCTGILTGIQKNSENTYYIACIDKPELKRVAGKESERKKSDPVELTLKGTNQLLIKDVSINRKENNSVIKDSISPVKVKLEVETLGGAEEGKSRCKYRADTTEPKRYSMFSNDRSRDYLHINTHNLYLPAENYKYFIVCEDDAGNGAETMINFSVEVDKTPPVVVRIYKEEEGDFLKIITDETGECVYSTSDSIMCTYLFEDGVKMTTDLGREHYTSWNINTNFYIKCRDEYKTPPFDLSECSIIVRPFEITPLQ